MQGLLRQLTHILLMVASRDGAGAAMKAKCPAYCILSIRDSLGYS